MKISFNLSSIAFAINPLFYEYCIRGGNAGF